MQREAMPKKEESALELNMSLGDQCLMQQVRIAPPWILSPITSLAGQHTSCMSPITYANISINDQSGRLIEITAFTARHVVGGLERPCMGSRSCA